MYYQINNIYPTKTFTQQILFLLYIKISLIYSNVYIGLKTSLSIYTLEYIGLKTLLSMYILEYIALKTLLLMYTLEYIGLKRYY